MPEPTSLAGLSTQAILLKEQLLRVALGSPEYAALSLQLQNLHQRIQSLKAGISCL